MELVGPVIQTIIKVAQSVEESLQMPIPITVAIFGFAMKVIKKIQIRVVA